MVRAAMSKVKFGRRFIQGKSGKVLPPCIYEINTDEDPLAGVSVRFSRRVLTLLHLLPQPGRPGARHAFKVDFRESDVAPQHDKQTGEPAVGVDDGSATLHESEAQRQADVDRRASERGENDGTPPPPT